MARCMWIEEGLYALLKSKADEWGYDTKQLLVAAAAYGLGDMILACGNPDGFRHQELARLEQYIAAVCDRTDQGVVDTRTA